MAGASLIPAQVAIMSCSNVHAVVGGLSDPTRRYSLSWNPATREHRQRGFSAYILTRGSSVDARSACLRSGFGPLKERTRYERGLPPAMDLAMARLKENPRLGYPGGYVAYIAARSATAGAEDEIAQAVQLSPGETKVIRSAVLTYEALGQRDRAI